MPKSASMPPNSSWTEEEWRWFQLSLAINSLTPADIESLEQQLNLEPSNMDVRVQVFAYYGQYEGNGLKHKNAEKKLAEQILWLIENKPSAHGYLAHKISSRGNCFKPKAFATLRQAWLEQVSAAPLDGTVLGNAASFIVWKDFETASELFERAYALQPEAGWLGTFVIHCNSELWFSPELYKDKIRDRIIDVGVRSLDSEFGGAPFLTCEYVSDAALSLGRFDLVLWCAELLSDMDHQTCKQMANAYCGLVALRGNNRDFAVQMLLKMERGYQPQEIVLRLAGELFDAGERESIVQFIENFKGKVKKSWRERWIKQIANNERPAFEEFHRC